MPESDIRRLDFALLLVLSSLLRTRKSTVTAVELHMTQSTVSHALARLRDVIGDPLFLRRPHGLEPTSRALELWPLVDELLGRATDLLAPRAFDPSQVEGVLRIAAADYEASLLSAPLIARLGTDAPKLKLVFRPFLRDRAAEALLSGEVDVALGRFFQLPSNLRRDHLFEETYSVVARADHPLVRGDPDLDTFRAARHIVVSLDGTLGGVVDRALAALGADRTVVAGVPYFLTALAAVATSDTIATVPTCLARTHAERFGLAVWRPPLELKPFNVEAVRAASLSSGSLAEWIVVTVLPQILPQFNLPRG